MKQHESSWLSWFAIAFCMLLILGQLGRIQITPTIAIYVHDLLIAGWLGWWSMQYPKKDSLVVRLKKYLVAHPWVLALGVWMVFGSILATITTGSFTHWLYALRVVAYAVFSFRLVTQVPTVQTSFGEITIMRMYLLAGLGVVGLGLLQYVLWPDLRFLANLGWDDHYYRLVSTQLDPAYAGAILILTFFGLFQILTPSRRIIGQISTVVGIALTFSRASYLAFAIGLIGYVLLQAWRRKLDVKPLVYGLILVVCIWLAPKPTGEGVNLTRTSTIVSRTTSTTSFISQLKPWQWIFGSGLFYQSNDLQLDRPVADHASLPDNLLVLLFSGLGIGGIFVLIMASREWWPLLGDLPSWTQASLTAIVLHSQFNNTLFQPFVWLMLCGVLLSSWKLKSKRDL